MMINANPVVHASFYDESGINISDSGIRTQDVGHATKTSFSMTYIHITLPIRKTRSEDTYPTRLAASPQASIH